MIYIKSVSELKQISNENYRRYSAKSVVRLYAEQTSLQAKGEVMGTVIFLIGRRIREHSLKISFDWFARYFLARDVLMSIGPEEFHLLMKYDEYVASFDFKDSILVGMGTLCQPVGSGTGTFTA